MKKKDEFREWYEKNHIHEMKIYITNTVDIRHIHKKTQKHIENKEQT
jgi:hypothetical protein